MQNFTRVYIYREHNYGNISEEMDVCGDVVVLSDLEKAVDIVAQKIKERCGLENHNYRKYYISETNMRPDFPADPEILTENEIKAVIDEELKNFDENHAFYIRLYPDYPDNEDESLAYVIEKKTIDHIDVF